jgi:cysteine-rich repeat protein
VGVLRVRLLRSAVLRAVAVQANLLTSAPAATGVLEVRGGGDEELRPWGDSHGWWALGDSAYHYGAFQRPRQSLGGSCRERFATHVRPGLVAARQGVLGALSLRGPECKGGAWDIDPGGESECGYHPLLFWGPAGYAGRAGEAVEPAPACRVSRQPSLASLREEVRGVAGLAFDPLFNRGLVLAPRIEPLLAAGALPAGALTVEVQFTAAPAALRETRLRALLAAQQDGRGRGNGPQYAKGLSLLWLSDASRREVTLSFSLATAAANDANDQGGLRTLSRALPAAAFADSAWTHVAGVYNGSALLLYVNGSLAAARPACPAADADAAAPCGAVTYPREEDPEARAGTPLLVGAYTNGQTADSLSHAGLLAELRLLGRALTPQEIAAAAERLALGNPAALCAPGLHGPYQGVEPCRPCPPGTVADVPGLAACAACPQGQFAAPGARLCLGCPPGLTTAGAGAAGPEACVEPNECETWSGLPNSCDEHATCVKVPGSYECFCNEGFAGDGRTCAPECADGLVVGGEECDDGNGHGLDGCDADCAVEEGWTCAPPPGGPANATSECKCGNGSNGAVGLRHGVCCHREYARCLHEAGRLTAAGLDAHGCMQDLSDPPRWVLGQAGESCTATCAALPGGEVCVPHTLADARPSAVRGGILAEAEPALRGRADGGCERAVHGWSQGGRDPGTGALLGPDDGLAFRLRSIDALPMVDDFGADGERRRRPDGALLAPGDAQCEGAAVGAAGRVCYVWEQERAPLYEGAAPRCDATPTVHTGRRLCRCRPKSDVCSRQCVAALAQCLASDEDRVEREEAAREEFAPCLDNPAWWEMVNTTEPDAPGGEASNATESPRLAENWTCADYAAGERFCSAGAVACGACPRACGQCTRCWQDGEPFWHNEGRAVAEHPGHVHPSAYAGMRAGGWVAPGCLGQDATNHVSCRVAQCKKGLAHCSAHGMTACTTLGESEWCFGDMAIQDSSCFLWSDSLKEPGVVGAGQEASCGCTSWFHNCMLHAYRQQ